MALVTENADTIIWRGRPIRGHRREHRLAAADYEVAGGTVRRKRRPVPIDGGGVPIVVPTPVAPERRRR